MNRANPNGHAGMIYCSNLCTEIAQNMAPIETVSTEISTQQGDPVVVTTTRPGEFVVCNLASLSLGNLPVTNKAYMNQVVATAVRALDNVIDLNFYPLPYAKLTNGSTAASVWASAATTTCWPRRASGGRARNT